MRWPSCPAPGSKPGEYTEGPIPPEEAARVARYHAELVEAVASTDDGLLERFFAGEELPGDEELAAFRTVAPLCKPALLEPLDALEVTVPEGAMGDVLGDLASRRAQILGTDVQDGGRAVVRAVAPRAELHGYATALQSLTHGRASLVRRAHGYEVAPAEVAARVAKARQAG